MQQDDLENALVYIINQIFEIDRKLAKLPNGNAIKRHVENIKERFEGLGLIFQDPCGERYTDSRTDCEASIAGKSTDNLFIKDVIKPIIRSKKDGKTQIVQRAVVIVETQQEGNPAHEQHD